MKELGQDASYVSYMIGFLNRYLILMLEVTKLSQFDFKILRQEAEPDEAKRLKFRILRRTLI